MKTEIVKATITAGEWIADGDCVIVDGRTIVEVRNGPWPRHITNTHDAAYYLGQERRANARLIAAAKDLLGALRGLVYLTDQGREGGLILSRADGKPLTNEDQDVIDRAYIAADKARAKATGETL